MLATGSSLRLTRVVEQSTIRPCLALSVAPGGILHDAFGTKGVCIVQRSVKSQTTVDLPSFDDQCLPCLMIHMNESGGKSERSCIYACLVMEGMWRLASAKKITNTKDEVLVEQCPGSDSRVKSIRHATT